MACFNLLQPLTVRVWTGLGCLLRHRSICEASTGLLLTLKEGLFVYSVLKIITFTAPPRLLTPSLTSLCCLEPRCGERGREGLGVGVWGLGAWVSGSGL